MTDETFFTDTVEEEPVDMPVQPALGLKKSHRQAVFGLCGLVLVAALAMIFVPIDGAVIAPANVGVESRIKRISHPFGGVITQIHVEDGDQVAAGDLLMSFDDAVAQISASLTERSVDQLLAQRARLEAEQANLNTLRFPATLTSRSDDAARSAISAERRMFALHRSEMQQIDAQLEQRIAQFNEQIRGLEAQIAALEAQQAFVGPELEGLRELRDDGYVTITRLNELERTAVGLAGSIGALRAQIAEANARIAETREQQVQSRQSARANAGEQLAQVNAILNERQVSSVSARDTFERTELRALEPGIIHDLLFSTVGDVVRPADTIMEIVPVGDELVLEAMISPADIDQVRVGQQARARFTAFNSSATPEISGQVVFVAAELTQQPETGLSYYRARIALDADAIAAEQFELIPGMPAEAYISTGRRSLLSFLTKPIRDQFARAFRS